MAKNEANGLASMSDQFKGLPMEELIGGPLSAACRANLMLAKSTADFINQVGFVSPTEIDAKTGHNKPSEDIIPRMVDFSFERPGQNATTGELKVESVRVMVPLLAIVPVPNLQIDTVNVNFDMEVRSSTSEKSTQDQEGSVEGSGKAGWGPFSVSVTIKGKVSAHKEHTRSSDNSAKYHVEVSAKSAGIPEGLARVLDILATAATPRAITAFELDSKTCQKTGEGKLVDSTGRELSK